MASMRERLTNEEWNAISKLTSNTKLDSSFDITFDDNRDYFYDFEEDKELSLKEGLDLLYNGLAYTLEEEGMSEIEANLIVNLFIEFNVRSKEKLNWLLEKE